MLTGLANQTQLCYFNDHYVISLIGQTFVDNMCSFKTDGTFPHCILLNCVERMHIKSAKNKIMSSLNSVNMAKELISIDQFIFA